MQKVRRRFQFDAILDQFGKAGKDFAFSLVELLVVIAVIGILIALLFPALSGAKLRAQQIQCFSNIRQLGLASLNYANDNNKNPQYTHPAFPGGGTWMANLTEDLKSKALLICPSAPLRSPPPKSGNRQGAAGQAWVRWTSDAKIMFTGSYGYNGWFYPDLHKHYPWAVPQDLIFPSRESVQQPMQAPALDTGRRCLIGRCAGHRDCHATAAPFVHRLHSASEAGHPKCLPGKSGCPRKINCWGRRLTLSWLAAGVGRWVR